MSAALDRLTGRTTPRPPTGRSAGRDRRRPVGRRARRRLRHRTQPARARRRPLTHLHALLPQKASIVNLLLQLNRRARPLAAAFARRRARRRPAGRPGEPGRTPRPSPGSTAATTSTCLQDDMGAALTQPRRGQVLPADPHLPRVRREQPEVQGPDRAEQRQHRHLAGRCRRGALRGQPPVGLQPHHVRRPPSRPRPRAKAPPPPRRRPRSRRRRPPRPRRRPATSTHRRRPRRRPPAPTSRRRRPPGSTTTHRHDDPPPATPARRRVADDLGIDPDEKVAEGAPTAPGTPTLTVDGSTIVVTWEPSADVDLDSVTGYVIQLSGGNRAEVDAETTTYEFTRPARRQLPRRGPRGERRSASPRRPRRRRRSRSAPRHLGGRHAHLDGRRRPRCDRHARRAPATPRASTLDVELHSDPVLLATVTTDDQGAFSDRRRRPAATLPRASTTSSSPTRGTVISESPVTARRRRWPVGAGRGRDARRSHRTPSRDRAAADGARDPRRPGRSAGVLLLRHALRAGRVAPHAVALRRTARAGRPGASRRRAAAAVARTSATATLPPLQLDNARDPGVRAAGRSLAVRGRPRSSEAGQPAPPRSSPTARAAGPSTSATQLDPDHHPSTHPPPGGRKR